ncbi:MAG: HipA domain-containing protein [Coxiellaceae bacterium]|nr:HipA domain-containing protein [Coxiellaceae bacterium]
MRFSLAGVQLKFSALLEASGGLTIPAHGVGGDWIIKLPSTRFESVPENEFAMMQLASQTGINVPEIKLMPFEQIKGLEMFEEFYGKNILAVKRFDRDNSSRIHIEDLSQVFSLYPHSKYNKVSYNNIATSFQANLGIEAVWQFIERLAFNIIISNYLPQPHSAPTFTCL